MTAQSREYIEYSTQQQTDKQTHRGVTSDQRLSRPAELAADMLSINDLHVATDTMTPYSRKTISPPVTSSGSPVPVGLVTILYVQDGIQHHARCCVHLETLEPGLRAPSHMNKALQTYLTVAEVKLLKHPPAVDVPVPSPGVHHIAS